MIKTEFYRTREDGVDLYRTYSDRGVRIVCDQTNGEYDEVVNTQNSGHTYTETDTPIISEEITDTEALNILMGRGGNEQE